MCGSEAVPAIMQSASVTNFHESIPPSGSKCCVTSTFSPAIASAGGLKPYWVCSSAARCAASP